MSAIDTHIIEATGQHQATVIWLHGLGADGFDFAPVVPELKFINKEQVKFIFPHAPVRPITINNGFPMRGWYDILSLDPDNFTHDIEGIRASSKQVIDLVEAEIATGIDPSKILLAGFSQGGAIALFSGLTGPHPIAGILALSTYLPSEEIVILEKHHHNVPILMIHGSEDAVIRLEYAKQSAEALTKMQCDIEFAVYPMAHTLCAEEVHQIANWIQTKLEL